MKYLTYGKTLQQPKIMAKAIHNLPYIISGLCFSLIIAVGAGYIKFLLMSPGDVNINISYYESKHYAELVLENNEICDVTIDYPYLNPKYTILDNKIILPIESNNTIFVPVSVKYECKFLAFHKAGNEMIYAQIN